MKLGTLLVAVLISATAQLLQFHLDGPRPETLDALTTWTPAIAEVSVDSVFPAIDRGSGPLVTDSLLKIERVIKGPLPASQIVVVQFGGVLGARRSEPAEYAMLEAGKRYILFLSGNPPAGLPDRGIPRYLIQPFGLVHIEAGKVSLSKGTPPTWKQKYDGLSVQQLIDAIGANSGNR